LNSLYLNYSLEESFVKYHKYYQSNEVESILNNRYHGLFISGNQYPRSYIVRNMHIV